MEWGLTPEYINENWTEELLGLFFTKREEAIANAKNQSGGGGSSAPVNRVISSEEMLKKIGQRVRQVKVPRRK